MNIQSVKSRLVGSYVFLIILFIIQIPVIYKLVGGMTKKYPQITSVATLRKRAVELTYILNRHILNGEEELEAVFQTKKKEFDSSLETLRKGSENVQPITETDALAKFEVVVSRWKAMRDGLDEAMSAGDNLSSMTRELEDGTFVMVGKLNEIVLGFVALNDKSYGKSIDLAGLQRMRTAKMAYLVERYARSNFDLKQVGADIQTTMNDFEATFKGLRYGSKELGLKPVPAKHGDLIAKFVNAEQLWSKRRGQILYVMGEKDTFYKKNTELANIHTPQLVNAAEDLMGQMTLLADKSAANGLLVMMVAVLISAVCTMFFMWLTNHHLLRPILRVKETVEGFSRGDLTKRAGVKIAFLGMDVKDEVTSLGDSVDQMGNQMSGLISRISDSSSQLASASEQLASSATQIAAGADKQSGQTVQIASAMEEMNATVIEVAKNSQQVSESARGAQAIAIKGGDVVSQAIIAMKEVSESTSVTSDTIKKLGRSSEEIGTIVSVINDIADQTNLLALNAAIEAARAGEQGRGFAVVADEVRKLAERTTKATKEISAMIGTIQTETSKAVDAMADGTTKVEKGVKLANEAGDALKRIVSGVENVTDMISHIATSAEEQSSTTDEITQNMDSIADVAKANVTAIGEVSRATSEMARLATDLKSLVTRFTVAKQTSFMDMRAVSEPVEKGIASGMSAAAMLKGDTH
ncbi:MAG: type IV pili methyl-accepting chemotaxis transducer N-terminal domain-containing protein [Deltaproteobacteria bacterium]|nr:type IV pili methyl-accepting chemotaxis transducer N-terminal domain-containing protein [Deltaproteobacteria bacterium]